MRKILTSFALVAASLAFAQVGVNNDTPQATLDVKAKAGKVNGILVPRVSRAEAAVMAKPTNESGAEVDIIESTLIYVNELNGTASGYATKVNKKGFYYFKDGEWVNLSTPSSSLGGATGKSQILPSPVLAEHIDNDTFAVIVTGGLNPSIILPTPTEGRVIAVNNQTGDVLSFTGATQPANVNGIESGGGFFLIAHNGEWYLLGGLGA